MLTNKQNFTNNENIDFIGDIHGCYSKLIELFKKLGYQKTQNKNFYHHPKGKKVFFLGDIIDRGEDIFGCVAVVKEMIDNGQAEMILGNHEYNYISYFASSPEGQFTNNTTKKNLNKTYQELSKKNFHEKFIEWLYQQPILVESKKWRAIHACWDFSYIEEIKKELKKYNLVEDGKELKIFINKKLINDIHLKDEANYKKVKKAINNFLSSPSIPFSKKKLRVKWWLDNKQEVHYRKRLLLHPEINSLEDIHLDQQHQQEILKKTTGYPLSEKPLFIGHYWFSEEVKAIQNNLACLDYSAINHGKLVAYCYERENKIQQKNFIYV